MPYCLSCEKTKDNSEFVRMSLCCNRCNREFLEDLKDGKLLYCEKCSIYINRDEYDDHVDEIHLNIKRRKLSK